MGVDLVVEFFEGSTADKKQLPRIHGEFGFHFLVVFPDRRPIKKLLSFEQGQQRVLGGDALHVGLARNAAGDFVHLVHADRGVFQILPQGFGRKLGTEEHPGPGFQFAKKPRGAVLSLDFGGQRIGIDDDHDPKPGQILVPLIKRGDGLHEGGLTRARAAEQEHVGRGQSMYMLV